LSFKQPKKPQLFTQSVATGVTSPAERNYEAEDNTVDDCRVSSSSGRSSDVFDEELADDCTTCEYTAV